MNPQSFNLPHNEFRPHQLESIQWCTDAEGTNIIEAPTGSGKTSYAAAMSSRSSVIALCRTKNLQDQNYGRTYGFDVLFGRANYRCRLPGVSSSTTCADCKFDDNMTRCPVYKSCLYVRQKELCKASTKVSLNYAYYMVARWPREHPPNILFLDEAHELHEQVVNFAGCTVTQKDKTDWELPDFPELKPTTGGGLLVKVVDPLPQAREWLESAIDTMRGHWSELKNIDSKYGMKRKRKCERLGRKLKATIDAVNSCPEDWFISSGSTAQKFGRERRPAFICKPLTARHHAPGYFGFNNGQKSVLMSATIGNFDSFAKELGIREFNSLTVPNQYTPDERPVYVLDVPSMGSRARDAAFEKQADEIASAILNCPNNWPGIILVTRKREAKLLADRLARRGLQDRVWVPPGWDGDYKPTDEQARAWDRRKKKVPNSICLSWSFWVGYDGLDEKILIAAKAPFPVWGSKGTYEGAWRGYSMSRYRWAAANTLAQGLGRPRRGRPEDYDLNGEFNGFVAVADSSYRQIKKYLPLDVQQALVEQ